MKHDDLLKEIAEKKDLTEQIANKLHAVVRQFVDAFKVS